MTLTAVDNFKRNEATLKKGKGTEENAWLILFEAAVIGTVNETKGYMSSIGFGGGFAAAYWKTETFTEPKLYATISRKSESAKREGRLYSCLSAPGESTISGYLLITELETGGGELFKLILWKIESGAFTELANKKEVKLAAGDLVALNVTGGKVKAEVKIGAGAWEVKAEKADSKYTTGYVGVGAKGLEEHGWQSLEAETAAVHAHTFEISQNQTPTLAKQVSKTESVNQTQTPTFVRAVSRTLPTISQTQTATVEGTVFAPGELNVSQSQTPSLTRSVTRTFPAISQSQTVTINRTPTRIFPAISQSQEMTVLDEVVTAAGVNAQGMIL